MVPLYFPDLGPLEKQEVHLTIEASLQATAVDFSNEESWILFGLFVCFWLFIKYFYFF